MIVAPSVVIIHIYNAHYVIVACNIYILNRNLRLCHILCRPPLFFLEKGIKFFKEYLKTKRSQVLSAPE